jgi:hypothetical protein
MLALRLASVSKLGFHGSRYFIRCIGPPAALRKLKAFDIHSRLAPWADGQGSACGPHIPWNFDYRGLFSPGSENPHGIDDKRRAVEASEEAGFLHVFDTWSLEPDQHSADEQQWRCGIRRGFLVLFLYGYPQDI